MNKKGIILAYEIYHEANMPLKQGDLVQRLDEDEFTNNYYTIIKIEKNKDFPYFLHSKANGEFINFSREELVKCHCAFFDYESYVHNGSKILLGSISIEDIQYIKAKKLNQLEMGWSQLDKIKYEDLINLDFEGYVTEKKLIHDSDPNFPMADIIKYFRVNKN